MSAYPLMPAQGTGDRPVSMYTIESTVTRLLVATKQLLESLTRWAHKEASEQDVSDIYVTLGNEFNIACRAFLSSGIEVADLGDVPQALRLILEKALSEEASQENLDHYLPHIRDIIVTLLRQLKQKQMLIRSQSQNSLSQHPILQRNYSAPSGSQPRSNSNTPPLPSASALEKPNSYHSTSGSPLSSSSSTVGSGTHQHYSQPKKTHSSSSLPSSASASKYPTRSSEQANQANSNSQNNGRSLQPGYKDQANNVSSHSLSQNLSQSALSASHNFHGSTEPNATSSRPSYARHSRNKSSLTGSRVDLDNIHNPHNDPLEALQRGEALERRASRRFSAYQFAKLTNGSSSRTDIPDVPPLPSTSSGAGMGVAGGRSAPPGHKGHSTGYHSSQGSMGGHYLPTKTPRSAHMAEYTSSTMLVSDSNEIENSPNGVPGSSLAVAKAALSGSTAGADQLTTAHPIPASGSKKERPISLIQEQHQFAQDQSQSSKSGSQRQTNGDQQKSQIPSDPNKLVLFLQVARRVKKCVVDRSDLTIPSLRLLFVDKFAYPISSEAIPDIYIQDPTSGIRYELDEDGLANDIHQGSLISFNVEAVDEVKKHIDDGFANISKQIADINNKVTAHGASIERINEMQGLEKLNDAKLSSPGRVSTFDQNKQLLKKASFGSKPRQSINSVVSTRTNSLISASGDPTNSENAGKVEALRRELSSVKKISAEAIGGMRETINDLISKAKVFKSFSALPPPGDSSRSFMERSFKKLTGDADKLLTNVDDLQDVIEDLRKDVAQRGVRPDTIRIDGVSNDVQSAIKDLDSIGDYIQSEKAGWKKIWERELDKICEEQQLLKFHEEIIVDLKDDLTKAEETFNLVKQCSSEAVKNSSFKQVFLPPPVEGQSVVHAKDAVMDQVVALQIDHEKRLEAIERAEKKRKKDLQNRGIDTDSFLREFTLDSRLSIGSSTDGKSMDGKAKCDETVKKKKKKNASSGEEKKKKKKSKSKKSSGDDELATAKKKKRSKEENEHEPEDEAEEKDTTEKSKDNTDEEVDDDDDDDEVNDDDEPEESFVDAPSTPILASDGFASPGVENSAQQITPSNPVSSPSSSVTGSHSINESTVTPNSASRPGRSLAQDNSEQFSSPSSFESSQKLQAMTQTLSSSPNDLPSIQANSQSNVTGNQQQHPIEPLSTHSKPQKDVDVNAPLTDNSSSLPKDSIVMPLSNLQKTDNHATDPVVANQTEDN